MATLHSDSAVLAAVPCLLLASAWYQPSGDPRPALAERGAPTGLPASLPSDGRRLRFAASSQGFGMGEGSVHDAARQAPRHVKFSEPLREKYSRARDLHDLLGEVLPAAAAGERTSQYHVYLILSRCQTFLRMDQTEARELNERVLRSLQDAPADVRQRWESEFWRCQPFAGTDFEPLRAAMGADTPGAEVEYASVWFERAMKAGYPPALAEAALRINLLSVPERIALLEEAVQSGDPDVYWQLFQASPGGGAEPASVQGMAWLILACRRGQDCSDDAEWFRHDVCRDQEVACNSGESALDHYWHSLDDAGRDSARRLADRMESDLGAGVFSRLPWPQLAKRNIYANRFADAKEGG